MYSYVSSFSCSARFCISLILVFVSLKRSLPVPSSYPEVTMYRSTNVWKHCNSFTHSAIDGHLNSFQLRLLWIKLLWTAACKSFANMFLFPLGQCLEMELLGHNVSVKLYKMWPKCFPKQLWYFTFSLARYENPKCSISSLMPGFLRSF